MKDAHQLRITNTTDSIRRAIILGHNKFLVVENFGSEQGISIKSAKENFSYQEILCEIAQKPFEVDKIRVQSSNIHQICEVLRLIDSKAGVGKIEKTPINMQAYFSAYQQQSSIIEAPMTNVILDGSTYFEYDVLPNTELLITFIKRNEDEFKDSNELESNEVKTSLFDKIKSIFKTKK